jgi:hypothetical protein
MPCICAVCSRLLFWLCFLPCCSELNESLPLRESSLQVGHNKWFSSLVTSSLSRACIHLASFPSTVFRGTVVYYFTVCFSPRHLYGSCAGNRPTTFTCWTFEAHAVLGSTRTVLYDLYASPTLPLVAPRPTPQWPSLSAQYGRTILDQELYRWVSMYCRLVKLP